MDILFAIAIGILIGWNVPQPSWARDLQDRVVHSIKAAIDKMNR